MPKWTILHFKCKIKLISTVSSLRFSSVDLLLFFILNSKFRIQKMLRYWDISMHRVQKRQQRWTQNSAFAARRHRLTQGNQKHPEGAETAQNMVQFRNYLKHLAVSLFLTFYLHMYHKPTSTAQIRSLVKIWRHVSNLETSFSEKVRGNEGLIGF